MIVSRDSAVFIRTGSTIVYMHLKQKQILNGENYRLPSKISFAFPLLRPVLIALGATEELMPISLSYSRILTGGDAQVLAQQGILLSAPAFLLLGVIRVAAFYYQSTGNIIKSSWLIYGDSFLALPICEKNDFPYQYEF